jgi:CBS domain-containing protein
MLVSQILKDKGEAVFTASPSDTVAAAAALMVARRVGSLVIVNVRRNVVGVVSERDIVRVVAEMGEVGLKRPLADFMSPPVLAKPSESVDMLLARVTDRRTRHLPVLREGKLAGIVSIGDLVKSKISETEAEASGLKAYISS